MICTLKSQNIKVLFLNSSNICFSRSRKKNVFLPCENSIIFILEKISGFEKNVELLAVTAKGLISYEVHFLPYIREGTSLARKPVSRSLSPTRGINTSPFFNYGQKAMKHKPTPSQLLPPGHRTQAGSQPWVTKVGNWKPIPGQHSFWECRRWASRVAWKSCHSTRSNTGPFPGAPSLTAVQLHTTNNSQDFNMH